MLLDSCVGRMEAKVGEWDRGLETAETGVVPHHGRLFERTASAQNTTQRL